ncbi:hypothetical protein BD560DRAFT_435707 [Blakeslea trispora]|nr:hypothetical protein BD560DRAFT_435707 [Blakeslea trispora]
MSMPLTKYQKEHKVFVSSKEKPILEQFLADKKDMFKNHIFLSHEDLRDTWRSRHTKLLKERWPNISTQKISQLCRCKRGFWRDLFLANNAVVPLDLTPHNILFLWCYACAMQFGDSNVTISQTKIAGRKTIKEMKRKDGSIKERMERKAVELLEKFDDISSNEKATLKLLVSGILNCIELKIFPLQTLSHAARSMCTDEEWQRLSKKTRLTIDKQEEVEIRYVASVIDKVLSQHKDMSSGGVLFDLKSTTMALLKQMTKETLLLFEECQFNQTRHTILEIYKYFVLHIPLWKKNVAQEDEYVSRVKEVLNLVFYDTSIVFASGETGANCTKVFRHYLEGKFGSCFLRDSSLETVTSSTPSSSSTPLPVGVAIAENEEGHVEIYFNKKPYIKNLKARKIDIRVLKDKKEEEEKKEEEKKEEEEEELVCMDWCGPKGYTYSLTKREGVLVANAVDELELPEDLDALSKLEETLIALFKWKKHVVALNNKAKSKTPSSAVSSPIFHSPLQ